MQQKANPQVVTLFSRPSETEPLDPKVEKQQLMALMELISGRIMEITPSTSSAVIKEAKAANEAVEAVEAVEIDPVGTGLDSDCAWHLDSEIHTPYGDDIDFLDAEFEVDEESMVLPHAAPVAPMAPMAPIAPMMISSPVAPMAPMAPMAFMQRHKE